MQLNQVIETGFKLNTSFKFSENFSWLNGYSYTETGTQNASELKNPTYQIIKKRVQRNHGLFSELSYGSNTFFIRAGARLNYFERLGSFLVEPRININQKLSNTISINLQGEFKNQTITQFVDLNDDFLGVENRRWIVSDGNTIPIIKSKQVSLGVNYKNKGWFIELSPFYKEVNGIITESQGFTSQNQYDGFVGSSTAKGLGSGIQFRTGRPYTIPIEGQETYQDGNFRRVNYGDLNIERLPNYMRLDASTSYEFKLGNTQEILISLGILNVLNKNNTLLRYYEVSSENSDEAIQIEKLSLALTPNFSVRYKF